jgi:hypothetical protein
MSYDYYVRRFDDYRYSESINSLLISTLSPRLPYTRKEPTQFINLLDSKEKQEMQKSGVTSAILRKEVKAKEETVITKAATKVAIQKYEIDEEKPTTLKDATEAQKEQIMQTGKLDSLIPHSLTKFNMIMNASRRKRAAFQSAGPQLTGKAIDKAVNRMKKKAMIEQSKKDQERVEINALQSTARTEEDECTDGQEAAGLCHKHQTAVALNDSLETVLAPRKTKKK